MRILYHHRTRGDGAEGIHVAEIVAALQRLGHDVSVVCPRSAKRSPGLASVSPTRGKQDSVVRVFVKQLAEIAYNFVSYFRVTRGISNHKPDFIYERYASFNFAGIMAAKRHRVPIILEVNATFTGKFGSRFPVCFPAILRRTETYSLENASGIIVVSEALKSCVAERNVDSRCITVSPNAINKSQVLTIKRDALRVEKRLQFGFDDSVVIGFVGSLRKWHGIDFFADAMIKIARAFGRARFVFVGSGEYEEELRHRVCVAGLDDKVHMLGAVPHHDVYPLIAMMDIGVMPDSNEFGSPMKILEYMAMGCVPVGPRIGPIEEIIEDEITGKIFDRRDSESLTKVIVGLCRDEQRRIRISKNAREYVVHARTWEQNASEIIELYEQIASSSRKASNQ